MKSQKSNKELSLGEGNTPLLRLNNLEDRLGWSGQLWAKAEYQNPTGSFKDRGSIVEISEALRLKKKGVVCASTGNMAASLAAYSAKAKLNCIVVVPKETPVNKLRQATISGAQLFEVNGNYDDCVGKAQDISKDKNYLLCGDYELRRKGQRSIGTELAQSKILFDAFVCPVGNGTVGCAVIEGFVERNQRPKFIGVQGKGADPIFQAWKSNYSNIRIIEKSKTIASAMNVGNPLDGELTLNWIKKTNGMMISVSDLEIKKAQKLLARTEGIYVELSAAATVTGILKKVKDLKKLKVVLILTGSGLKEGSVPSRGFPSTTLRIN